MMSSEKFPNLPPFAPRQFVPPDACLTDPITLSHLFRQLLARPISSSEALEQWLKDCSELDAALDQTEAILYVQMTCQTDDEHKAERYRVFMETVEPIVKEWSDQLDRKFLAAEKEIRPDPQRYGVFLRSVSTDVRLFRHENVELEKKEDALKQDYQTICAAMTVSFQGRELTLQEASKYLLEPDRRLREAVWRLVADRRREDQNRLDTLIGQMIEIRHTMAHHAGYDLFPEYCFLNQHKFDYAPVDCKKYHDAVKNVVVPVWDRIMDRRKKMMKLAQLRPWDTAVDPLGRPSLQPFRSTEDLVGGCHRIFSKIDRRWGGQFGDMIAWGVLDLASHKGKAPGGYQSTLDEARRPFIFMNAVGVDGDVMTLLHEGGHAFHALACQNESWVSYRHPPLEFCEVASMGMELLGGEFIEEFYNPVDARRSRIDHLEDIIGTFLWVAVIDAFQHWMYEHPCHTPQMRVQAWTDIHSTLGGNGTDWGGLESERAVLWQKQVHIFETPFYYIEYAIAQLGALQLWQNYCRDASKTLKQFNEALALGGSQPLPELFNVAGLRFDFSEPMIRDMITVVEKELESLYVGDAS